MAVLATASHRTSAGSMAGVHPSVCPECWIRTDTKNHRVRVSNAAREGEPIMKFFRDECAQATVMMAMSIFCLCGMAGMAVDVGTLFRTKRVLQAAADAGAVSGAAEYRYGGLTAARAAAKAATAQNGESDTFNGVTVAVNNPASAGSHTGPGTVEVIVTQAAPTYFMKIFNLTSMNVSARAVAGLGAASGCIYTLDTSGTDVGMTGSGTLSMPDCGIVVDSGFEQCLEPYRKCVHRSRLDWHRGRLTPKPGRAPSAPPRLPDWLPSFDPLSWLTAPNFDTSTCLAGSPLSLAAVLRRLGPSVAGGTVCYNGLSHNRKQNAHNDTRSLRHQWERSRSPGRERSDGSGVTIYLAPPERCRLR